MNTQRRKNTYQYTVWFRHPTDSEKDQRIGETETVDAFDVQHVERIAVRSLPEEWAEKLDNIKIDVRPF
jgi:hypothetical protein